MKPINDHGGNELFFVDTAPQINFQSDQEYSEEDHEEYSINDNSSVWKDDDTNSLQVDLESHSRLKKLRKESDQGGHFVSGTEYEDRLRGQYEKIYPKPQWAKNLIMQPKKKQNHFVSDLKLDLQRLSRCGIFSLNTIKDGIIKMKKLFETRLKSENQYSPVRSVNFHSTGNLVISSCGSSKTCYTHRISYDDTDSAVPICVRSTLIKDLLLNQASCTADGQDIFLCGHKPFYYTQHIETGQTEKFTHIRSPFSDSSILEHLFVDPSDRFVAFGSDYGQVHVISRHSKQHLTTLKMNGCGIVSSVAFNQDSILGCDSTILTFSEREMYFWDLRRSDSPVCIKYDTIDDISTCATSYGGMFAYGSKSGVVQLCSYKSDKDNDGNDPCSFSERTFMNLTTSIDKVHLTHEWLAMSSSLKRNAMRLVHLPSGNRVISNWPNSSQSMGYIHSFDISPDQNYFIIGNHQGRLSLFQLNK